MDYEEFELVFIEYSEILKGFKVSFKGALNNFIVKQNFKKEDLFLFFLYLPTNGLYFTLDFITLTNLYLIILTTIDSII